MNKSNLSIPKNGISRESLLQQMKDSRTEDVNWREGRAFCLVYHPGEERAQLIKEAYNMFLSENALNPTAFPSLRKFEGEVISMSANLFNGDEEVTGSMTSGGTESVMMAVKTARQWARKNKPEIQVPEVILPVSAHPAFQKAFYYLGVKGVVVPVGPDFRADMKAVRAAINENTVMLVGSAPSYPQGVIDPIEEMSDLALEKGLLLHVDACIGGFLLPFARKLGYPIYNFDFSIEGVTSISADLHKYGYAAKGASVILYRNAELRKHQFYVYTEWPGGIYGSPTMTGTRPGGAIAAAWAALNFIGEKGYLEMAKATMETTRKILDAIAEIPALKIWGSPDMSIISFGSESLDIFAIADELNLRGWHFDKGQNPASIHLTISYGHEKVVDTLISDLKEAVAKLSKFSVRKISTRVQIGAVKSLIKLLPDGAISRLQAVSSGSSSLKKGNTAAMYGMMGALSGRGDLDHIVLNFLDKLNSLKFK